MWGGKEVANIGNECVGFQWKRDGDTLLLLVRLLRTYDHSLHFQLA
jgi:hypothetical protein